MLVNRLKELILGLPLLICIAGGMSGCVTTSETKRVVFLKESDQLLRLGNDVEGHIYFWNGSEWERSSAKVKLPEGWLTGPDPDAKDKPLLDK